MPTLALLPSLYIYGKTRILSCHNISIISLFFVLKGCDQSAISVITALTTPSILASHVSLATLLILSAFEFFRSTQSWQC